MLCKLSVLFLLAFVFALAGALTPAPAAALGTSFIVSKAADAPDAAPGDGKCKSTSGGCTLRAAIMEANSNPDHNFIYLKQGTTYHLNSQVLLQTGMDIYGAGVDSNTIEGPGQANPNRIFEIQGNSQVVIMDVTLRNGVADEGGAIKVPASASLWLEHVTLSDNVATVKGGALKNGGSLVVVESTLTNNTADTEDGGAIFNSGQLDLYRSTLNANKATLRHGGALANSGTARVVDDTLSSNTAGDFGGAIFGFPNAHTRIYNSTIVFNNADGENDNAGDGGGVYNNGNGELTLANSIVALNHLENGLIDPNDDCGGLIISEGHNLLRTVNTCNFFEQTLSSVTDGTPQLAPLQDNGGRTKTYALKPNSLGIDLGNPNRCNDADNTELAFDQRGFARSVDGNGVGGAYCDTGAFEFNAPDPCQYKTNPPAVAEPANNASSKQRMWLVNWSPAPCAQTYKVTIKQDSKKGATADQISGLVGTHFVTKKLAKHHTYYLRLAACNPHGCTNAPWIKFQVK